MLPPRREQSDQQSVFEPTQWTVVLRAAGSSADATQAFERLATVYWRPLFNYIRRRGQQPADAEDLTQSFFEYLVREKPLESIDPAKGRFRSFLLALLRHFLSNKRDYENAQKRGGGHSFISWDNLEPAEELIAGVPADSPEEAFDRDWANAVVQRVLARLREEYAAEGRALLFDQLQSRLVPAASSGTYAETAREAGLSEEAARMAAMRLRRRFHGLLREAIAETVGQREDVDEELRYLSQLWLPRAG